MQPSFLPWIGYLDLIDQSDAFVFLDDVQFEKQSWQQRNRLRAKDNLLWLTIPILRKGKFGQKINEVMINDIRFKEKHIKTIKQCYVKSEYYELYNSEIINNYEKLESNASLSEFNIQLIRWLCEKFGISTEIYVSSELNCSGARSELLINICKKIESRQYLSPYGASNYLLEDAEKYMDNNIDVYIQNYSHPVYEQVYTPFISHASAIDLLFNYGPDSMDVVRTGRNKPALLEKRI